MLTSILIYLVNFDSLYKFGNKLWTLVGIRVTFSFPVAFEIRSGLGVIKWTMNMSTYQIGPLMH